MIQTFKHPNGGKLVGEVSPNGLWLRLRDTRIVNGVRRDVSATCQECGRDGWRVWIHNDNGTHAERGPFKVATPWAAYELA